MSNLFISINILNISFSIINLILSIILESQKNSFNSATKTTLVRYRYFEDVLINPYFKLIITSFFYDILYYSSKFLLTKYFFNIKDEKNEENIRTKSIQENMVSNIMVEFLFMSMIKGIALGFGFFYCIELDKEIKRIIKLRDINNNQENILNGMLTVVNVNGIFNILTIVYQFMFFGVRLFVACKNNKKNNIQENHLERKHTEKELKKVRSEGNISLPETQSNGDDITYEKLNL